MYAFPTCTSTPEYEPKTTEARLGKLVEEAGEVIAAAGKSLRFGLESTNPTLHPKDRETNRAWLLRELRDLARSILVVQCELGADPRQATHDAILAVGAFLVRECSDRLTEDQLDQAARLLHKLHDLGSKVPGG